jgi:uncharacterized membrane protein
MDTYNKSISKLATRVDKISPQSQIIMYNNVMVWKPYYNYISVPVVVLVILLVLKPKFIMEKKKKKINIPYLFYTFFVISIILLCIMYYVLQNINI